MIFHSDRVQCALSSFKIFITSSSNCAHGKNIRSKKKGRKSEEEVEEELISSKNNQVPLIENRWPNRPIGRLHSNMLYVIHIVVRTYTAASMRTYACVFQHKIN